LDLSYDGTGFSGWAAQPGRRTVQDELERALGTVLRIERPRTVVAGRTDAGVHARGQVVHVDVPESAWTDQGGAMLPRRLAGVLPADVRVRSALAVTADFDARFGALWRHYRYLISDAPFGVEPLSRLDTVAWRRSLDTDAMAEAAVALVGLHDFAAYCRRREGATTIRDLQVLTVTRSAHDRYVLSIEVRADAFCHSMVRSLVGALALVGERARPGSWPGALLAHGRRCDEVPVAPAAGLTLVEVRYPPDDQLAARGRLARASRQLPVVP
jgi:tRNA pseudouridine38-40 synthase